MSAYSDAVLADGPSFLVACDEVAGTQTNLAGGRQHPTRHVSV